MINPKHKGYLAENYRMILDDLTYPVDREGNVMDASAFKAWVGWHLIRCGWRKPNNTDGLALKEEFDDPLIKSRRVYGPGVYEDAVQWVPFSAPDDPLEHLNDMTMGQIEALPEDLRAEAKRRLGLASPAADCSMGQPSWSVKPFVHIEDAPLDDSTDWSATKAST